MNNVHEMNPTTEPDIDELQAIAHRNGAAKAVFHVLQILENDHKRLSGEGSTAVKVAKDSFELKLGDETLRPKAEANKASIKVLRAVNALHWSTADGMAERDALASQADAEKKGRKSTIDAFELAEKELLQQRKDTNQSTFPFVDDGKDEDAGTLGHTTKSTKAVVYAALRHMDEKSVPLGPYQIEVLDDLACGGVDIMDLGMSAEDAVEQDEDEEEVPAAIEIEDVFN